SEIAVASGTAVTAFRDHVACVARQAHSPLPSVLAGAAGASLTTRAAGASVACRDLAAIERNRARPREERNRSAAARSVMIFQTAASLHASRAAACAD